MVEQDLESPPHAPGYCDRGADAVEHFGALALTISYVPSTLGSAPPLLSFSSSPFFFLSRPELRDTPVYEP